MGTNYKNLIVWQKTIKLIVEIYSICKKLPPEELYGLSSQMKRASISIASNIAEGSRRATEKDRKHFIIMSFGSASELETQLEILRNLPMGKNISTTIADGLLEEVLKMLNKMSRG